MTVLVVDDQINVVNGIVSGVDWASAGVSKVLHAYNATMARDILENQPVDILLSDIEMPVEDGLSLLRWIRNKELPVECIFLTAHADFIYAAEALKLGSFDYLLQPARYEEICGAVRRAVKKVQQNLQEQQIYSYGKAACGCGYPFSHRNPESNRYIHTGKQHTEIGISFCRAF